MATKITDKSLIPFGLDFGRGFTKIETKDDMNFAQVEHDFLFGGKSTVDARNYDALTGVYQCIGTQDKDFAIGVEKFHTVFGSDKIHVKLSAKKL